MNLNHSSNHKEKDDSVNAEFYFNFEINGKLRNEKFQFPISLRKILQPDSYVSSSGEKTFQFTKYNVLFAFYLEYINNSKIQIKPEILNKIIEICKTNEVANGNQEKEDTHPYICTLLFDNSKPFPLFATLNTNLKSYVLVPTDGSKNKDPSNNPTVEPFLIWVENDTGNSKTNYFYPELRLCVPSKTGTIVAAAIEGIEPKSLKEHAMKDWRLCIVKENFIRTVYHNVEGKELVDFKKGSLLYMIVYNSVPEKKPDRKIFRAHILDYDKINNNYIPATPHLIEVSGSEMNSGVIFNTLFSFKENGERRNINNYDVIYGFDNSTDGTNITYTWISPFTQKLENWDLIEDFIIVYKEKPGIFMQKSNKNSAPLQIIVPKKKN